MNLLSKSLYHIAVCRKKISFEYYGFIFPQFLTLFVCFVYCLYIRDECVEIRKYYIGDDGDSMNLEVCNKIELSRIVFIVIVYLYFYISFNFSILYLFAFTLHFSLHYIYLCLIK